jgi:hypothetical protein
MSAFPIPVVVPRAPGCLAPLLPIPLPCSLHLMTVQSTIPHPDTLRCRLWRRRRNRRALGSVRRCPILLPYFLGPMRMRSTKLHWVYADVALYVTVEVDRFVRPRAKLKRSAVARGCDHCDPHQPSDKNSADPQWASAPECNRLRRSPGYPQRAHGSRSDRGCV